VGANFTFNDCFQPSRRVFLGGPVPQILIEALTSSNTNWLNSWRYSRPSVYYCGSRNISMILSTRSILQLCWHIFNQKCHTTMTGTVDS